MSAITLLTSTSLNSVPLVREKFSRLLTISEARKVWRVIFSSKAPFCGSPCSCFASICAYDEMTARGVLTSWATPAASNPMDDSLSACESCDSSSIRSVMSSMMISRPITLNFLVTSGAIATFRMRLSPVGVLSRNLYRL